MTISRAMNILGFTEKLIIPINNYSVLASKSFANPPLECLLFIESSSLKTALWPGTCRWVPYPDPEGWSFSCPADGELTDLGTPPSGIWGSVEGPEKECRIPPAIDSIKLASDGIKPKSRWDLKQRLKKVKHLTPSNYLNNLNLNSPSNKKTKSLKKTQQSKIYINRI